MNNLLYSGYLKVKRKLKEVQKDNKVLNVLNLNKFLSILLK